MQRDFTLNRRLIIVDDEEEVRKGIIQKIECVKSRNRISVPVLFILAVAKNFCRWTDLIYEANT